MEKSIISEGKTSNEAIQKGLNKLNLSKKDVDIEILEDNNKKSFFNILAPRVVKVKITVKDNLNSDQNKINEYIDDISDEDFDIIYKKLDVFLKSFIDKLNFKDINYNIINNKTEIKVDINGSELNLLIGYRGETLNAFQTIINRIGNNNELENKHRIIVDIAGYRQKRIKALEELAIKVSKTVENNKKSITLEPMSAFERKIIHNKLQNNSKVTTYSVGKEPNRKVVIELKK